MSFGSAADSLCNTPSKPPSVCDAWQQMLRLDYSPQDSLLFQQAIEQVAVPAATRMYEKRCRQLGLEQLRPWDLDQDLYPLDLPPLPSYGSY